MEDALELSGEEGRGKLRKAAGKSKHLLIRRYPNVVTQSVNTDYRAVNKIAVRSETQGTEPSKYLEEKKSTEIPRVAASEMGGA
jgi:hypothetical protein